MSVHWPEMIDGQEKNTVFLKPLVTSPKIEVGEFTYYNDTDDPTLFEIRNVLYTAGPEKLIIGKFCAIAAGVKFLLSSANHPMLGSTAFPFFIFGGTWLEKTAEFLPRIHSAATLSSETTYGSAGKPLSCPASPSAMAPSSRPERSSSPTSTRTPWSEAILPST
jgi:hypothetical protein